MPPEAASVAEYAMPTIPLARAPLAVLIAGLTGTVSFIVPAAVLFATEVAVTVTVSAPLTVAGAVYVAAVVVLFDSVPQADPVQLVPAKVHVTPSALVSLVTVADKLTESPGSMLVADGRAIETWGVDPLPPPLPLPPLPCGELPQPVNPPKTASVKTPELRTNRRGDTRITGLSKCSETEHR